MMEISLVESSPLLRVEQLSFSYELHKKKSKKKNEFEKKCLDKVSFSIKPNKIIGLIGPNGSGKSTLLKLIAGVLPSTHQTIFFYDTPIENYSKKNIAKQIAMVFQNLEYGFDFSIQQFVLTGRYAHRGSYFYDSKEDLALADWAMTITRTIQMKEKNLRQISQGERQRVALAAAMVQQPDLMLLDEPTAALDIKYQIEILKILTQLITSKHLTIIMAIHDLNLAAQFCDEIILLKQGKLQAQGAAWDVFTEQCLEEVFETPLKVRNDILKDSPFIILDPLEEH